jgi:hypothetical protein
MKNEYTPGPWESGRNPKGISSNEIVVRPAGQFPYGEWIADCGSATDKRAIANARLIAAAPELLDALTQAVASHPFGRSEEPDWLVAAQAAIAKSRGG